MARIDPEARRQYFRTWWANRTPEQREEHRKYRRERTKAWRERNPEKAAARSRLASRRAQGIVNPTDETRIAPCEICGTDTKLHYDHDHETGLFRGWLCPRCNVSYEWYINNKEKIAGYGIQE